MQHRPRINHRASEFWEMAIVVDGAEASTEIFTNERDKDHAVDELKAEYAGSEHVVELFILEHRHSLKIECECGQFLLDHKPDYTFGEGEQ